MSQQQVNKVFRRIVPKVSANLLVQLQAVDPMITGVHYKYGHYNDIRRELKQEMQVADLKKDRYPLILIIEDYRVGKGLVGISGQPTVQGFILHHTDKDYTREQREAEVFDKVLYPIYYNLLREIARSGDFQVYDETMISHTMIPRPMTGIVDKDGTRAYIFDDILDGIELNNLSLKLYLDNCVSLRTNL